MSLESPQRLKHGAELGPILKAAESAVSPERIASNHAAVKAAIAAGVVKSIPLWIKLGVPVLLLVGGYALYRFTATEPAPVVATVTIDAAPIVADAMVVELDAEVVVALDAAPSTDAPLAKKQPRVVAEPPPVDRPSLAGADAGLPPSDLPAQIALYEQARDAAANGDIARGIDLLDELAQRYPSTQLRAEAELTRAELLTRANRLDEAATALEALAASPTHRGRRGELYRTLGDVRRKQGDCPRAVAAYTRAKESKLSPGETANVMRGLERCK